MSAPAPNADSVPTEATTTCTECRVPLAWHPSYGWIAFPAYLNATDEPDECPRGCFGHDPKDRAAEEAWEQNDGAGPSPSLVEALLETVREAYWTGDDWSEREAGWRSDIEKALEQTPQVPT